MPSIVWKGHLTFGLVSIPVKLFRAARRERVRLHYVHQAQPAEPAEELTDDDTPDLPSAAAPEPPRASEQPAAAPPVSRVQQTLVRSDDQQPVSRADVSRAYEVEPERYVVLEPDELRALRRKTSPVMEIVRSVKLAEIDPVFFETSYYVAPDRGGEKAYAILYTALRATDHVALARVGMYGREHVVIVRPGQHGILAHTMFYVDEISSENEFRTDVSSVGGPELDLATKFLEALEAPFSPEEFKDTYREELQALVARKMAQAGVAAAQPTPITAQPPVIDILEALKKSLAMAKKPEAAETQPPRKSAARAGDIKSQRHSRKAR